MDELTTAERLSAAGIKRPINWGEMGSSAKDLWEERMLRSIEMAERARARRQEQNQ